MTEYLINQKATILPSWRIYLRNSTIALVLVLLILTSYAIGIADARDATDDNILLKIDHLTSSYNCKEK